LLASFSFLRGLLQGPPAADLSIGLDQLARRDLRLAALRDCTFRLTDGGRRGQMASRGCKRDRRGSEGGPSVGFAAGAWTGPG
jgi:hypothetical protein